MLVIAFLAAVWLSWRNAGRGQVASSLAAYFLALAAAGLMLIP